MARNATLAFTKSPSALFSPSEVRSLMRVEFERARRYGYPICCLALRPDRIQALTTVHGDETRIEIQNALVELVRGGTRAGDLLGYVVEDRIMLLLPHTRLQDCRFLCQRLLDDARRLEFSNEAQSHRITLSIGVSHNQHPDACSFETLEQVAGEGLSVAENGGGDQYCETDLYDLYAPEAPLPARADAAAAPTLMGRDDYRGRLEQMMSADGDLESAAGALAEEIIGRVMAEAEAQREASEAQRAEEMLSEGKDAYEREIDQLQRRIAKLTESLGVTEQELARVRDEGSIEAGISSIYRTVQGLGGGDAQTELKKDLMQSIFQANLDLQRKAG